ncbi:uncharacterized protein LOC118201813 [Stegodyphus dumicola]|uniref:uncharacterized protein LOC118201813 n=1 Tax=Stegodyphus dumicola TaxID=202533 RepID=UPI0015AD0B93|nr:uncharacterized protein LOC118201813 [Stegodyphus dumicola]
MIIRIPLTLLQLIVCCLIVKRYDCESDVIYKGKMYVSDGEPINISCIRSAYGTPKWTRNGLAVDLNDPQYFSAEEYLPSNRIRMELGIKQTFWEHRGEYKCDPLSSSSHRVEIVPSKGK